MKVLDELQGLKKREEQKLEYQFRSLKIIIISPVHPKHEGIYLALQVLKCKR